MAVVIKLPQLLPQPPPAASTAVEGDADTIIQAILELLYVFHPNLKSNAMVPWPGQGISRNDWDGEKAAETLYYAAALHDIAIPGVDRPIIRRWLRDPEKLNKDEMKLVSNTRCR